jgi:hypothetical protein
MKSDRYLAFDIGFPNAFDRSLGRTGSFLMVHGGCKSVGCYAMTDYAMDEIYGLADEAFRAGQEKVQLEAFPFRMTTQNLARHHTAGIFWLKNRDPQHWRDSQQMEHVLGNIISDKPMSEEEWLENVPTCSTPSRSSVTGVRRTRRLTPTSRRSRSDPRPHTKKAMFLRRQASARRIAVDNFESRLPRLELHESGPQVQSRMGIRNAAQGREG